VVVVCGRHRDRVSLHSHITNVTISNFEF